jgi:hemerythrin-like domain-containing protein
MKATELLVNQHHELEQLFEQLDGVEEGDEKVVREELTRNLVGHMMIEEEIFYPAMREAMPERIALAEVEHASARYALAQLLATPPGDPTFHAKVSVLDTMIRTHVDMEEKEILPKAESSLGPDQIAQLSRRMEARHEEVVSGDFIGMLKQKLMHELPAILVPRAAGKTRTTATKKRAVRATAKKATPVKRGATAKRGAPTKRAAVTKRATGTKRGSAQTQTSSRGGSSSRTTSKRGARKRAS